MLVKMDSSRESAPDRVLGDPTLVRLGLPPLLLLLVLLSPLVLLPLRCAWSRSAMPCSLVL